MLATRISSRPTSEEISEIFAASEAWATANSTSPLSDHLRLALESSPTQPSQAPTAMLVTLITSDHGDPDHGSRPPQSPSIVAYAVAAPGAEGMVCETAVRPDIEHPRPIELDALTTLAEALTAEGSPFSAPATDSLIWWVDETVDEPELELLAPWTLEFDRTLFQMRIRLDGRDGEIASATVDTRRFVVGQDDAAWLRVNNRAFAGHPEQDGWNQEMLAHRIAEPWFDPAGFRLYEVDGELAAFCWTKIHLDADPLVGEIYVIAVDPAFHGRGLGRQLTLSGLDAIRARGVDRAILFVDAANAAAVHLYGSIGFSVERSRTAYRMVKSGQ